MAFTTYDMFFLELDQGSSSSKRLLIHNTKHIKDVRIRGISTLSLLGSHLLLLYILTLKLSSYYAHLLNALVTHFYFTF